MVKFSSFQLANVQYAMRKNNFVIFKDPEHRGYDLNLVFIRADLPRLDGKSVLYRGEQYDTFNGHGVIFWRDPSSQLATPRWNQVWFPVTTVPGLYWLKTKQSHGKGTGIIKAPQQVRGAYTLAGWGRTYQHLNQVKPFVIIRDANYDKVVDLSAGKEELFNGGFEYHRARAQGLTLFVSRWSAGCQVNPLAASYDQTISVFQAAIANGWKNSFTSTWLLESEVTA